MVLNHRVFTIQTYRSIPLARGRPGYLHDKRSVEGCMTVFGHVKHRGGGSCGVHLEVASV
jgi:hypothetical protein